MHAGAPVHLRADDIHEDLTAHYPWPAGQTWVRAMMVTTLDGAAAGVDGLSGSISSSADQRVFNTVRRHADAVLIGAHTMRTEEYSPMLATPDDAETRARAGQRAAPVITVVSASLNLPWDLPVWTASTHTPIVITGLDAPADQLNSAKAHADVIALSEVTPHAIIASLAERGLRRIVCEGGPRLLRDLSAADVVDEANITIAPLISGTAVTPSTVLLPRARRFRLVHTIEDAGYLMTRYLAENR